jgi:hypothetical protein
MKLKLDENIHGIEIETVDGDPPGLRLGAYGGYEILERAEVEWVAFYLNLWLKFHSLEELEDET